MKIKIRVSYNEEIAELEFNAGEGIDLSESEEMGGFRTIRIENKDYKNLVLESLLPLEHSILELSRLEIYINDFLFRDYNEIQNAIYRISISSQTEKELLEMLSIDVLR